MVENCQLINSQNNRVDLSEGCGDMRCMGMVGGLLRREIQHLMGCFDDLRSFCLGSEQAKDVDGVGR